MYDDAVPSPDPLPSRVAALVAGLIVHRDGRWGAAEVAAWAAGASPAPPTRRPEPARPPFAFAGDEQFHHVEPLMVRMQEASDHAAAALFGSTADRWAELTGWLTLFDRPDFVAADVAAELDRRGREGWSPDARLLLLIRRTVPGLRPSYRGVPLDRALLRHGEDDPRLRDLVGDLWRWRLLTELDGARGTEGFAAVDDLWQRLDGRWCAVATVLRTGKGRLQRHLADLGPDEWRTELLRLAAEPARLDLLREERERVQADVRALLDGPLDDLDELVATVDTATPTPSRRRRAQDPDVDELVGLLMVDLVADGARAIAHRVRDERDRAVAAAATRAVTWRQAEHWRAADRPVAMGWAAGVMGLALVVLVALLVAADAVPQRRFPLATDDRIAAAWAFVTVGLTAQTACEVWLAALIGGRYDPEFSLHARLLRAVAPVAAFGRHTYRYLWAAAVLAGALVAAGVVLVGLLVAPYAVMLPLLVAHVWWAWAAPPGLAGGARARTAAPTPRPTLRPTPRPPREDSTGELRQGPRREPGADLRAPATRRGADPDVPHGSTARRGRRRHPGRARRGGRGGRGLPHPRRARRPGHLREDRAGRVAAAARQRADTKAWDDTFAEVLVCRTRLVRLQERAGELGDSTPLPAPFTYAGQTREDVDAACRALDEQLREAEERQAELRIKAALKRRPRTATVNRSREAPDPDRPDPAPGGSAGPDTGPVTAPSDSPGSPTTPGTRQGPGSGPRTPGRPAGRPGPDGRRRPAGRAAHRRRR